MAAFAMGIGHEVASMRQAPGQLRDMVRGLALPPRSERTGEHSARCLRCKKEFTGLQMLVADAAQ
eukprot:1597286-Alexandrium_andersonii.AAC.1